MCINWFIFDTDSEKSCRKEVCRAIGEYCCRARGWIATSVFQTPIASGQHIGRKNLILVMIQGLLGENQDGYL